MRVLLITIMFTIMNLSAFSQDHHADTIVKLGGKRMVVNVTKVTQNYVSFKKANDPQMYTIERKQIQEIIYKSGKIEKFNKPVFEMIEGYQWEAVILTKNEKDVDGMYKRGFVSSTAAPSRTPKAAKKSATIRVQKKAANLKGILLLVTHEEARGGYGEMPGYYIEGEVYGLEPLEEGEDGASDDDKPFENGVVF